MNAPRSRAHVVGGLAAAAAAVLGLALVAAPSLAEGMSGGAAKPAAPVAAPSPSQPGGHTVLTCTMATAGAQPITFDPPVSQEVRTVNVRGTLTLTNCASPDSSFPNLHSGTVTMQGSGQLSCGGGAQNVTGTGSITWSDAQGKSLGTSTIRPNLNAINSYNAGDMLLIGEVTDGKMKGKRIAGNAVPTSDISQCSGKGVSSLQGNGSVAFIAVDTPK
ncbi:hypothetical protein [Microtetraspora fusca]|uniref:Secreted protein n=1 Tax=Microtetraspora fusca TaxID=1997 RepID=A0ABW6VH90_MICFU|nr:hypothetical protein [Microtetraspora fusca]